MKKRLYSLALAAILLVSAPLSAHAETTQGGPWKVAFTQEAKMESTFTTSQVADVVSGMQPGDDAVITLELVNENTASTEWYMTNKIISSLEDSVEGASGGAYTYELTYTAPDGTETELFSSDTVGGSGDNQKEGLHNVSDALKDYVFLGTLTNGQKGTVILKVALDGETQGNSYQDTLADLTMDFAVELTDTNGNPSNPPGNNPNNPNPGSGGGGQGGSSTRVVRTGDESNLTLFMILAGTSGVLFLGLAFFGLAQRRKEERKVR